MIYEYATNTCDNTETRINWMIRGNKVIVQKGSLRMETYDLQKEKISKGDKTGGHYLAGLIVLLLDAFYLHLPEHSGLWVQLAQITVVNDTWAAQNKI